MDAETKSEGKSKGLKILSPDIQKQVVGAKTVFNEGLKIFTLSSLKKQFKRLNSVSRKQK